jgi:hypothetical protein
MKQITLQFSTTSGIISHIVRAVTWSSYSHVDYVTMSNELLGAQWDGVKVRQPGYQKFIKTDRVTLDITDGQYSIFIKFLADQIGKKYDATALFGILGHRDWQSPDKWFCSELMAAALVAAGILKAVVEGNRITPEMLREMVGQLASQTVIKTKDATITVS